MTMPRQPIVILGGFLISPEAYAPMGREPNAKGQGEQERIHHRPPQEHVDGEDRNHQDQGDLQQQPPETAHAAFEFGFGAALPLTTWVPRQSTLERCARGASAATATGCLLTGKLSPVRAASLTLRSV